MILITVEYKGPTSGKPSRFVVTNKGIDRRDCACRRLVVSYNYAAWDAYDHAFRQFCARYSIRGKFVFAKDGPGKCCYICVSDHNEVSV